MGFKYLQLRTTNVIQALIENRITSTNTGPGEWV